MQIFLLSRPGPEVYVDGYYVGTTPVQVNLTVREDHVVEFRKAGHDTRTYRISRFVGFGWIVLDFVAGLVPLIIDLATGDWYMLDTEEVNVTLPQNNREQVWAGVGAYLKPVERTVELIVRARAVVVG